MSRILITLSIVLATSAAFAQAPVDRAVPAPPAAAPPSDLDPLAPAREPTTRDDTLDRIERRLDRIEGRLQDGRLQGSDGSDAVIVEKQAVQEPAVVADNAWRFKNHNGTWWYWLPSNRWVYWSNGAWADYSPDTYVAPQTVTTYRVPAYHYAPSYSYDSYPYYGNSYSYYGGGYPYYGRSYSYYGGGYPNYGSGYYGGIASGIGIGLSFGSGHHHHHSGHYHSGHGHSGHGHGGYGHGGHRHH